MNAATKLDNLSVETTDLMLAAIESGVLHGMQEFLALADAHNPKLADQMRSIMKSQRPRAIASGIVWAPRSATR